MYINYINGLEFLVFLTLLLTCFVHGCECMCAYARRSPSVCMHICALARPSGPPVCAYVRTCLHESVLTCVRSHLRLYI